ARTGANHATIAPYGPSSGADGQSVYLAIQNEREWKRFCEIVLGRPELAADQRFNSNSRRVENRAALDQLISGIFEHLTGAQIVDRLEAAQIAYAKLNSVQEFLAHPQLSARNRWRTVESPAGPIRALIPPV